MTNSRPVIAFVISDISQSMALEAFARSDLHRDYDLHFFILNAADSPFEANLRRLPVTVHRLTNHGWRSQPLITWKLYRMFRRLRPRAVHTTLLFANIFGQLAALFAGVKIRLHNRHHSDPYHHANRHGRFYDWLAQRLSTKVIVTSENVAEILRELERVNPEKIVRIPFGVDEKDFEAVSEERRNALRREFHIERKAPIIGMVSRYLEVKGLQFAIPAYAEFLKDYPGACLLIARGAGGAYSPRVADLLRTLPSESYRELPLVLDMPALYSLFDIFMHVPINRRGEASGQAYTEALAAGCPSIFTLSGLAPEFVRDGENALVVPFMDAPAIASALRKLMADPEQRRRLGARGKACVRELYPMQKYLQQNAELWGAS